MIVLTGAAGFIGSAFLSRLNMEGISDVIVVDNLKKGGKWKNLVGKEFCEYVSKYDFFDFLLNVLDNKIKIDAIIHLGACSSTTEDDMDYLYANNFRFSKDLLEYSAQKDIRFIYASSAAVYGDGKMGFSDDDNLTPHLKPLNKYGYSKWLFDNYVIKNKLNDFATGLRFFNVFGPNEYHKGDMASVVYKSYNQIAETGSLKLFKSHIEGFKDGEQKRDFIYVKDVCDIIWFFLNNNKGGIYNAGTGNAGTFNELAIESFKALNRKAQIEYIDMPESVKNQYQYFTQADAAKLREAGYDKKFSFLPKGIEDYIKNYLTAENRYI